MRYRMKTWEEANIHVTGKAGTAYLLDLTLSHVDCPDTHERFQGALANMAEVLAGCFDPGEWSEAHRGKSDWQPMNLEPQTTAEMDLEPHRLVGRRMKSGRRYKCSDPATGQEVIIDID